MTRERLAFNPESFFGPSRREEHAGDNAKLLDYTSLGATVQPEIKFFQSVSGPDRDNCWILHDMRCKTGAI